MAQPTADSALPSWALHIATAVVTGVVTTYVPVQRWSPPAQWALHGGMGALAAGVAAIGLTRPELLTEPGQERDPEGPGPRLGSASAAGIALALGALAAGASRGGQAADSWAERTLSMRGVRRPRRWMGVAAAGASLAMSIADSLRTVEEPAADVRRS